MRVVNEDHEIYPQVKLEFLCLEILLEALFSWLQQLLPSLKEVVFRAVIKTQ
jgi:hypothetical protein